MARSKKVCSTGYLVDMVSVNGKRYRYGIRRKYLEAFIDCAFDHDCTVEFIGFCKMSRNTGIKVIDV